MEAATVGKQSPVDGVRRFLGTRRGSFLVAALAALFGAIFLVAYLNNYKDDVRGGTVPTQVLIADRLIPKGTAGDVVATDRLFRPTTIAEDDVKASALADASALSGTVAVRDVFPGQQITAADFTKGGDPLRGRLTGAQRALAIPVDAAHGLVGTVRSGDKIDVLGSFTGGSEGRGVLRTLAQGVLVLKAPSDSGDSPRSGGSQAVILRLSDKDAARLAFAADNGKIWFALRPPAGVQQSDASVITQQSVAGGRSAGAASSGSRP